MAKNQPEEKFDMGRRHCPQASSHEASPDLRGRGAARTARRWDLEADTRSTGLTWSSWTAVVPVSIATECSLKYTVSFFFNTLRTHQVYRYMYMSNRIVSLFHRK